MPTYPANNPFKIEPIDFPAASGVRPGPAYPDFSGEPTVIVNPPSSGFGGGGGGIPSVPSFNVPAPGAPALPDWILPQASRLPIWQGDNPGQGSNMPWQGNAASHSSILQHALNVMASNFARQQNMNAFALHDWNRNLWAPNKSDPELSGDFNLMSRFGLMGRGAAGKWRGHQK